MTTSKKLDELIQLTTLLQNTYTGYTIDELCEKLERPRRATERLMELLRDKFGERLEAISHKTDRKKHWRFKKGAANFLINFSESDISKLEMLKNEVKSVSERKSVEKIIEKIKALNSKIVHKTDIDILLETQGLAVRQHPTENLNEEFMKKIEYSLLSLCKLKIEYKDSYGNFYTPTIEPYGIKIADYHYLIAKENNQIKTFKILRIENIEVLENEYFDKDEDFNINEYCQKSFGVYTGKVLDVVLKFKKEVKDDILNYSFHPTQTNEVAKDGSIIVKFSASGSYEIITELLKWRDNVAILEPKQLKDEYNNEIEKLYKKITGY
jgi:predicted DNA-binding transcriptional regulator YafY